LKTIINTPHAPFPLAPYNQGILIKDTLYVSGQIAINPTSNTLVIDDITAETTQVMANLHAILDEAQMSFDNVVKCSIFVKDLTQFSIINKVYGEYFKDFAPARETVEVSALPKGANIEISCVAVL
jgi:2-iminobutanoate/2-iminopropanoate deaminase